MSDAVPHPQASSAQRLPIVAFGMSLGLFLAVTFVICVAFDLIFPGLAMNRAWSSLLPGFTWLTWPSFFLGLIEAFAYGWYVALVFGPLYNFFVTRCKLSDAARASSDRETEP
jgi:hypothetical protein